jgi:hypothetical protein
MWPMAQLPGRYPTQRDRSRGRSRPNGVRRPAPSRQIPRPRSRSFRRRGRFAVRQQRRVRLAREESSRTWALEHWRHIRACARNDTFATMPTWPAAALRLWLARQRRRAQSAATRLGPGTGRCARLVLSAAVIATAGCSASLASVMPVPRVSPHRPANRAAWRPARAHGTWRRHFDGEFDSPADALSASFSNASISPSYAVCSAAR